MGEVLHGATCGGHSAGTVQIVEPLWQPLPLNSLASSALDSTETGQIGVWFADLRELAQALEHWRPCLSALELERSERSTDSTLRQRQAHSRILLRMVLGTLMQRSPESLQIVSGEHGKPRIADSGLHFNASHSGDLWLLAASRMVSVGVDIEAPRRVMQWQRLSQRVFSTAERTRLDLSASSVPSAFFVGWTRKEAVLKGMGTGFSFGAINVEAGFDETDAAVKFSVPVMESWRVSSLPPPVPCHAAIAWVDGPRALSTHRLTI